MEEVASMAESSNLMMKSRDLLATSNHEGLSIIVDQLYTRKDSDEYKTARALYDFCVAKFPNCSYHQSAISIRLNPPREVLVDNSYWVLAFVGGFCADHADSVKEIVYKMIESVRELVERGMEVGVVRRAFREMESIVKKQCDWYDTLEYRFVKFLLLKLYEIKGMKMESKIVLWRISVILEKGTQNVHKES